MLIPVPASRTFLFLLRFITNVIAASTVSPIKISTMYFQGSIPVLPIVTIMTRDRSACMIKAALPLIRIYLLIFLCCAFFLLTALFFLGGLVFCGVTLLLLILNNSLISDK